MAAIDDFANSTFGSIFLVAPCNHLALVSPSDSVDLVHVSRCIRVSTAGDVKVTTLGGETLVIPAMQVGEERAYRVTRVWMTGTTAAGISVGW